MAQREPGPPEYRLGDAVLETMRGALRILGGTVQMAVGMTRMLAGAVLALFAYILLFREQLRSRGVLMLFLSLAVAGAIAAFAAVRASLSQGSWL